jgi:hypothetical protein
VPATSVGKHASGSLLAAHPSVNEQTTRELLAVVARASFVCALSFLQSDTAIFRTFVDCAIMSGLGFTREDGGNTGFSLPDGATSTNSSTSLLWSFCNGTTPKGEVPPRYSTVRPRTASHHRRLNCVCPSFSASATWLSSGQTQRWSRVSLRPCGSQCSCRQHLRQAV